jgi:hypothetical protein
MTNPDPELKIFPPALDFRFDSNFRFTTEEVQDSATSAMKLIVRPQFGQEGFDMGPPKSQLNFDQSALRDLKRGSSWPF